MNKPTTELDQPSILSAVRGMYEEVAAWPFKGVSFPIGRNSCRNIGYPGEELKGSEHMRSY